MYRKYLRTRSRNRLLESRKLFKLKENNEINVIETKKHWVIDTEGYNKFYIEANKWSKNRFTKNEAIQFSKTLENCERCTDCINCKDCMNCKDCTDCENCEDCISCNNCVNLENRAHYDDIDGNELDEFR